MFVCQSGLYTATPPPDGGGVSSDDLGAASDARAYNSPGAHARKVTGPGASELC
jgi:hypothetical protein